MSIPMKWVVIADFFPPDGGTWLDDFIDDKRLSFEKIAPLQKTDMWHSQKGRTTGLAKWMRHFHHARRALAAEPAGIITCFPQLAMCVGLLLRFKRRQIPVVAHNFNVGRLAPGVRQWIARLSARRISLFLVHSPHEIDPYARYLAVDKARSVFVPLQRPVPSIPREEDETSPYILAMGSAHRDYATLLKAVAPLGIRTIVVTREDIIAELPRQAGTEFRHGLSQEECLQLLAKARLSVTPLSNMDTASGQVTFINAMQMGVPVIATGSPGTAGYIVDKETGYLVNAGDVNDLNRAIKYLWNDRSVRSEIAEKAKVFANENLSDAGAAEALKRQLLTFLT